MSNDPAAYDRTIDELASATLPLAGNELMALVQGGATKNAAISALRDAIFKNLPTTSTGLPSGAVWRDGTTLRIVP